MLHSSPRLHTHIQPPLDSIHHRSIYIWMQHERSSESVIWFFIYFKSANDRWIHEQLNIHIRCSQFNWTVENETNIEIRCRHRMWEILSGKCVCVRLSQLSKSERICFLLFVLYVFFCKLQGFQLQLLDWVWIFFSSFEQQTFDKIIILNIS